MNLLLHILGALAIWTALGLGVGLVWGCLCYHETAADLERDLAEDAEWDAFSQTLMGGAK